MRKTVWSRLLALLLVLSMFATPVSAAGKPGSKATKPTTSTSAAKEDKKAEKEDKKAEKEDKKAEKEDKKNNKGEKPTKPTQPTKPTEPVVEETEPVVEETVAEEDELTLIEGASNVDNGTLLRGSTFSLRSAEADADVSAYPLVYFPVTMFDYDQATIRNATNKIEVEAGVGDVWNGMYFSGGKPSATAYSVNSEITFDENNNAVIPDGEYRIYSSGNGLYILNTTSRSDWGTYTLDGGSSAAYATVWTVKKQSDGTYTIQDPAGKYMDIAGQNLANLSSDPVYMSVYKQENGDVVIKKSTLKMSIAS